MSIITILVNWPKLPERRQIEERASKTCLLLLVAVGWSPIHQLLVWFRPNLLYWPSELYLSFLLAFYPVALNCRGPTDPCWSGLYRHQLTSPLPCAIVFPLVRPIPIGLPVIVYTDVKLLVEYGDAVWAINVTRTTYGKRLGSSR